MVGISQSSLSLDDEKEIPKSTIIKINTIYLPAFRTVRHKKISWLIFCRVLSEPDHGSLKTVGLGSVYSRAVQNKRSGRLWYLVSVIWFHKLRIRCVRKLPSWSQQTPELFNHFFHQSEKCITMMYSLASTAPPSIVDADIDLSF